MPDTSIQRGPDTPTSTRQRRHDNEEIDTAYTVKVLNGKLLFQRDAEGHVVELRISNFGAKNVKFKKSPNTW